MTLIGADAALFASPLTLGIATGLVIGKFVGVFGAVFVMARLGLGALPAGATWRQMMGVALLCGIGFTMSLFVGLLAFDAPALQEQAKIGILMGSLVAGLAGYVILRTAPRVTWNLILDR